MSNLNDRIKSILTDTAVYEAHLTEDIQSELFKVFKVRSYNSLLKHLDGLTKLNSYLYPAMRGTWTQEVRIRLEDHIVNPSQLWHTIKGKKLDRPQAETVLTGFYQGIAYYLKKLERVEEVVEEPVEVEQHEPASIEPVAEVSGSHVPSNSVWQTPWQNLKGVECCIYTLNHKEYFVCLGQPIHRTIGGHALVAEANQAMYKAINAFADCHNKFDDELVKVAVGVEEDF